MEDLATHGFVNIVQRSKERIAATVGLCCREQMFNRLANKVFLECQIALEAVQWLAKCTMMNMTVITY